MEAYESSMARSGIRPPSRVPPMSPSRTTLREIAPSDTNVRAMPAASLVPSKHKPSGRMLNANGLSIEPSINFKSALVPEPQSKRKTLADRAGEPIKTELGTSMPRSYSGQPRNQHSSGVRGPLAASTSRLPSNSSRTTSANSTTSFANSLGHGVRPGISKLHRPGNAATHARSRSKSAFGNRAPGGLGLTVAEEDEGSQSKRECMDKFPLSPSNLNNICVKRQRKRDHQSSNVKFFSLQSTFQSLSIPQSSKQSQSPIFPVRKFSSTSTLKKMSLGSDSRDCSGIEEDQCLPTPSHIPRPVLRTPQAPKQDLCLSLSHAQAKKPLSPSKSSSRQIYLTRDSNMPVKAFDEAKERETFEKFTDLAKAIQMTTKEHGDAKQELIDILKKQVTKLDLERDKLSGRNEELENKVREVEDRKLRLERDVEDHKSRLERGVEEMERKKEYEVDDLRRKHRNELQDILDQHRRDTERAEKDTREEADRLRREFQVQADTLLNLHKQEQRDTESKLKTELEEERARRSRETEELSQRLETQLKGIGSDLDAKTREMGTLNGQLQDYQREIERIKAESSDLRAKLSESASNAVTLDGANRAMKAKIDFLESDSQAQSQAFNDLHRRMQEAIEAAEEAQEKLRAEEALRRKLHNQVQELKGNIRVFCRVRPQLSNTEAESAKIAFPDTEAESKEITVLGPEQRSAMGNVTTSSNAFSFDRVFGPSTQNADIFAEISQLVQSALDGYNVCIFCYGQTGAGKTHTMSSPDGMIPRATAQIYAEAQRLQEKGWNYDIQGSFVEVYNENLNDLLGTADDLDRKKLEIKHDSVKKQTTIQSATLVPLDSPTRVEEILKRADNNRTVAATKANERSSRSHSVFILKLTGINETTGERSEGTLNLVDLAGSERLSHSQATGDRLKETQNINRSLSCLGDVIAALGQAGKNGTGHIPYRNSKLTHLLQYSLGGNSKTLMFVMVSPFMSHLSETLTSLKFATKVHNTHIGTAKRQSKVKD